MENIAIDFEEFWDARKIEVVAKMHQEVLLHGLEVVQIQLVLLPEVKGDVRITNGLLFFDVASEGEANDC